ncbi:MAG TPA: cyclic 2,3-diphosphoglycerate synthase [Limnochordia bacterium]|nr:cyclic 2,3-diphosphoglycerate synthase [Limnochordia bacterium]HPZ30818.1 cyclic 2,3-diphosphoglycerate synthase [Limnochordia bacterium]HQD71098.1 cyclic 2,3-diphosphoglycerate synthase [Limnochordia bacterium]HXK97567.1 cyclic 2,3-diphosphoglycerate synthase [Limnochordia bacterium]
MTAVRVLIMGAAGRDFHNFNVYFRNNPKYKVVGFTATQIPNIEGRVYPASLAGPGYPDGIPIYPEDDLVEIIKREQVDQVIFAYSDVSHEYVMHKACAALAAGADFRLLGPKNTMLKSKCPVIAVCAARTGSGKSQTTRFVAEYLTKQKKRVVVIRHPMPYGDLEEQKVQRFAELDDLDRHKCTIEEREEYEPHIMRGNVLYAGVDYEAILTEAEKEADVILWDGGNNDVSFYQPDLTITVVDPHRPGHELMYYPGEVNLRMADVVIVNKVDTAKAEDIETVTANIKAANPTAEIILCRSPITAANPELLQGKRVLVVEDGPTLTHGEMAYGAGFIAAKQAGAIIVDPRDKAVRSIAETYRKYPHTGPILPAMGYGAEQIRDLSETIERCDVDAVVIGTPIDLQRLITISEPAVRVTYELADDSGQLEAILARFCRAL